MSTDKLLAGNKHETQGRLQKPGSSRDQSVNTNMLANLNPETLKTIKYDYTLT
jgi:hypothetical protein